jgi:hypothetical protein
MMLGRVLPLWIIFAYVGFQPVQHFSGAAFIEQNIVEP